MGPGGRPFNLEVAINEDDNFAVLMPLSAHRPMAWRRPFGRKLQVIGGRRDVLAQGELGPEGDRLIRDDASVKVIETDGSGPARVTTTKPFDPPEPDTTPSP